MCKEARERIIGNDLAGSERRAMVQPVSVWRRGLIVAGESKKSVVIGTVVAWMQEADRVHRKAGRGGDDWRNDRDLLHAEQRYPRILTSTQARKQR